MTQPQKIRARQALGKYRVERRVAQGGFADVYQAYDTIEGIRVALKIPQQELLSSTVLQDFKKEARLTSRLDHPNILPIKNASFIGRHFVIVYQLGDGTLADRLKHRVSLAKGLDFAEQVLTALAHAHSHRVMHCDVKPENFILFPEDHLRLTDFGISRLALRTMRASGSGTIGFMAPEQAMGRPSFRSDVFAAGLILYRVFGGVVPEWPFEWPPPGYERIRRRLHPDLVALLRRSLRVEPRRRFEDAEHMLEAFLAVRTRALFYGRVRRRRKNGTESQPDWREVRLRQFRRKYKATLEASHDCAKCDGPVSESMVACPWCSAPRKAHKDGTRFPATCPRCRRGVKLDWKFCPWCFGPGIGPLSDRSFSDKRYVTRCANAACKGELMPFMRYCPWCRAKVKKAWRIADGRDPCPGCGWGVLSDYWRTCPWCARSLGRRKTPPSRR